VIVFLAKASQVVLFLLGVFLMIVILLQRGRGGGLAGAFGGMGGQSAFGTKAGDVFTRITIVLAVCWVILAGGSGYLLRAASKGQHSSDYPTEAEVRDRTDPGTNAGSDGRTLDPPTTPAGGATTPTGESGSTTPSRTPASSSTGDPAPATTVPSESTTPSPTEN
jgi:preprotein translocase subunit SecG